MTPISIHPPARGGTSIIFTCYQIIKISIHPPARGGTLRTFIKVENYVFQSTHPQGVGQQKFTKQTSHSIQNQQK